MTRRGKGKRPRVRARFTLALRENTRTRTRALARVAASFFSFSFLPFFFSFLFFSSPFFLFLSLYFYDGAQSAPRTRREQIIFRYSPVPPPSPFRLPALSQTASGARPTLFMKFHFRYIMQSSSLSLLLRFIRYYGYYAFFSSKILHAPSGSPRVVTSPVFGMRGKLFKSA